MLRTLLPKRISNLRDRLRPGTGARSILQNASWIMGEQMIRMVAAIFVGVWIARRLGPHDFGLLSFGQAACSLIAVITQLGMNRMLVREMIERRDRPQEQATVIATVFSFRVVAAIALYALTCASAAAFGDWQRLLVFAFVGVSVLSSPFDCADQYFQSQSRSRVSSVARSVAFFVSTALKLVLLVVGAPLVAFAAAVAAEYAITAVALFVAYRRYGTKLPARPNLLMGLAFMRETWTEIVAAFSVLFFMRSGQIMLEWLRGSADVGVYAAASRLSEAWNFIPVSLATSAFPKILHARDTGANYMRQISRLMVVLVAASYCAGIMTVLLSTQVVSLLYGERFAASASILNVHIWCGLLIGFGTVSGNWLLAERKIALNLQRALLGMLASFTLGLILIPRFGAVGAAWSTFIAMLCAWYFFDLIHPSARPMFFIKSRALLLRTTK